MIIALIVLAVALAVAVATAFHYYGKASALKGQLLSLNTRFDNLADNVREADRLRFGEIATQAMHQNAEQIAESHEHALELLLKPLQASLDDFRKQVDVAYNTEARERFSLAQQIKALTLSSADVSKQAHELSVALRGGTKAQGDWGEMVLETLLEQSGLTKGKQFKMQVTAAGLRPDAVVYYPEDHCLVIDSKVSLTAYLDYINAETDEQRKEAARRHITSVKNHISTLKRKSYQDIVGDLSADFVILFFPNDGAYMTAMNLAPEIWQQAANDRVILVSPTHLYAMLKLVEQVWCHDQQNNNALEIANQAGAMYDKLVGFLNDIYGIRKALNSAKDATEAALNKLYDGNGNLVRRAEKLREMGAKATKTIPPLSSHDNN